MIKKMCKKNKHSIRKGLLLSLMSLSLALTYSVTTYASNDTSSYVSKFNEKYVSCNSSSFGDASNFAVFAKTYYAGCDMEGNVATQTMNLNGVHIGLSANVEGTTVSYIEKFASTSSTDEFLKTSNCAKPLILGNDYTITKSARWNISYNGKNILVSPISKVTDIVNIKNSEYKIDFEKEFKSLCSISKNLANSATTNGTTSKTETYNNGTISCQSGFNILNMTMAEYDALRNFNINLSSDATLVINLTDYNGQNLDNKISINGSKASYKGMAGNLLWNFGEYSKNVYFSETTLGCILAPCATVVINSTHNGNVIADTVKNPGGEIHKNDFKGTIKVEEKVPDETPSTKAPTTEAPVTEASTSETPGEIIPDEPAPNGDTPNSLEPSVTEAPNGETPATAAATEEDSTPQTGDTMFPYVCVAGLFVSITVFVILKLRKQRV